MDIKNGTNWRIRKAEESDREFWLSLDCHLDPEMLTEKLRDGTAFVMDVDGEAAAVLRFFMFWDIIPFCSFLFIRKDRRGRGYGTLLLNAWEAKMREKGHDLVMTSTQADEGAQHFYRKLGYTDCGGFILPFAGYEQPMELILAKKLD